MSSVKQGAVGIIVLALAVGMVAPVVGGLAMTLPGTAG